MTAPDQGIDDELDEDGDVDVEHFPLPDGLLEAAGIESDDDFDAVPEVPLRGAGAAARYVRR